MASQSDLIRGSGPRIHIREHVPEDLDSHIAWQTNPRVATYLSWLPRTKDEARAALDDAIAQQSSSNRKEYFMAVVRHSDAAVIGDVGITIESISEGAMGWFLLPEYWNHGYASEAVGLLIQFAFSELGLESLRASCRTDNKSSEGIMKNCGFVQQHGDTHRVHYRLLRDN